MKNLDVLYDLCEVISDEIEESNEKIRIAGGKLTAGDVDYIDKLTHALKSIKTTIAMTEADEYSYEGGGSYEGGSYESGGSYARGGNRGGRGGSYARGDNRGRGTYARRTASGRYSSRGYSRAEGVKEMLRDAMNEAETDREREAIRKALDEMER